MNDLYEDKIQQFKLLKQRDITSLRNEIVDTNTDKKLLLSKKQFFDNDIKNIEEQKKLIGHEIARLELQKNNIELSKNKMHSDIAKINNKIKLVNISKKEIFNQEGKQRVDIDLTENTSKINEQAIDRLKKEITEVEKNTREMVKNNNNVLKAKTSQSEAIALLMYSNGIQQSLSLLDNMNMRMVNLLTATAREKSIISKLKLDEKNTEQRIARKDIEIENINHEKELMNIELASKDSELNSITLKQADLKEKISLLDIKIDNKKLEAQSLIVEAQKFDTKVANLNVQLHHLIKEHDNLKPFKVISKPSASAYPVKPRKVAFILFFLFSSLLISILYLVAKEYIYYWKAVRNS